MSSKRDTARKRTRTEPPSAVEIAQTADPIRMRLDLIAAVERTVRRAERDHSWTAAQAGWRQIRELSEEVEALRSARAEGDAQDPGAAMAMLVEAVRGLPEAARTELLARIGAH
jgi:hypothetical protein